MTDSWWDYRIIRDKVSITTPDDEVEEVEGFTICEVYYGPDGEIQYWSEPIPAGGESLQELWEDFNRMAAAFYKPVLNQEDLDSIYLQ